jgi:nucleoside-diphosphate-sugar epimerase
MLEDCLKALSIFVPGGAGFLGSTLIPALLRAGYKVTVLDSLLFNQTSLLDCCAYENFDFIKGDICDFGLMDSLLPKFDVIIPLAAIVGAPACKVNPVLTRLVNRDAHLRIVETVSTGQMVIFPPPTAGTVSERKTPIAPRIPSFAPSRNTARPRSRSKGPSWAAATRSPSGWPTCSA